MSVAATVFVVRDLDKSVDYYRDVLGFQVGFTYGSPVFYAGLEREGAVIHLQAASHTKRQAGQGSVYIFVDTDIDALFRELAGRGACVEKEPQDYPYGMRDFNLSDLDGNDLCFGMESKTTR